jgi:hypothetical protein
MDAIMTTKSLSDVLSTFHHYPQTQHALRGLWKRYGEDALWNAAKTLQMIARDPIEGNFNVTATDDELLLIDGALEQEICDVARIFITEQSGVR